MWKRYLSILLVALGIALAGTYAFYTYQHTKAQRTDAAEARNVINNFGDQLQQVPLNAPPKLLAFAMESYYSFYVHPDLLAKWEANPLSAPGRLASSPWPDRIEVEKSVKNQDSSYTVDGTIVEVANNATSTQTVRSIPVQFIVSKGPDGWQITDYKKL